MATIAHADAAAARRLDLAAMVKEAGVTALVALVLTAPLVGIRTIEQSGSLTYQTDFTAVAIAVALVFLGRIGIILNREGLPRPVFWISLLFLVVFALPPVYEYLRPQISDSLPALPVQELHSIPLLLIGAFGALWLWRKAQGGMSFGQRERAVKLVDALPLGATGRLAVVEFGGKHLLVAVSRAGVQLVSESPAEAGANG